MTQFLNRYSYVVNNPTNRVDSSGLSSTETALEPLIALGTWGAWERFQYQLSRHLIIIDRSVTGGRGGRLFHFDYEAPPGRGWHFNANVGPLVKYNEMSVGQAVRAMATDAGAAAFARAANAGAAAFARAASVARAVGPVPLPIAVIPRDFEVYTTGGAHEVSVQY